MTTEGKGQAHIPLPRFHYAGIAERFNLIYGSAEVPQNSSEHCGGAWAFGSPHHCLPPRKGGGALFYQLCPTDMLRASPPCYNPLCPHCSHTHHAFKFCPTLIAGLLILPAGFAPWGNISCGFTRIAPGGWRSIVTQNDGKSGLPCGELLVWWSWDHPAQVLQWLHAAAPGGSRITNHWRLRAF